MDASADGDEEGKQTAWLLEDGCRLSRSRLWPLMRSFYASAGAEAWKGGEVPSFITSNAFIAHRYALMLRAWWRDCKRAAACGEQAVVVEVGAGSGKLGFLVIRALQQLIGKDELARMKLLYVLTDAAASNVDAWQAQPQLAELIADNLVDVAVWDPTAQSELHLLCSNRPLDWSAQPIAVIANYFFDSLPCDALRVLHGSLQKCLVSLSLPYAPVEPLPDSVLADVIAEWHFQAVDGSCTADAFAKEIVDALAAEKGGAEAVGGDDGLRSCLQQLLAAYAESLSEREATFLLPIDALRVLLRLQRLCSSGLFLLAADKATVRLSELHDGEPCFDVHGSISFLANFHAMRLWAELAGAAVAQCTTDSSAPLSVTALCFAAWADGSAAEEPLCIQQQFEEAVEAFGPSDFYRIDRSLLVPRLELKAAMAFLRLSRWDADMFYKLRGPLFDGVRKSPHGSAMSTLLAGLRTVERHYFLLDGTDVPFELGRLYYSCGRYMQALRCYRMSETMHGSHHATVHNQALCLYHCKQRKLAAAAFRSALRIKADYGPALRWLERVEAELDE
eukprot:PLAT7566.1.p1 GENE.PLAT7566.1~~PLAT7566.1.p1  ORF type:complete len:572 (+),score=191.14 PLAT7566.1:28-1716(+)